MNIELELQTEIIKGFVDSDAKRNEEWVTSWMTALFKAYEEMLDKGLRIGYEKTIEPLMFWMSSDEREQLGEIIWQSRDAWLAAHSAEEPFLYTGLATYLARSLNNRGS